MTTATLDDPSAGTAVTASLTYVVPGATKPRVETAALTGGLPRYHARFETRSVPIADARARADSLSLDREGFALLRAPSRVADFYDDAEVANVYYPEAEALLKRATGARQVLIFDHTRRHAQKGGTPGLREPATRIHNDYTDWSGRQRIRDLLGEEVASAGTRVAQVNVWRPIRGPVLRLPLAFLDAASIAPGDLVATDHVYPDRVGEIYHLAWNPAHRWFYVPRQTVEEVVLIKGYDTAEDGRARFTPHTAFDDPTSPPDAPPRESIELRSLLVF